MLAIIHILLYFGVGTVGQAQPMLAIIRLLRHFGGSVGQAPPFDAVWRRLAPFDGACFFRGSPVFAEQREIPLTY